MKALVTRALAAIGYEIRSLRRNALVPASDSPADLKAAIAALSDRLRYEEVIRGIHCRDSIEIEELLRLVALPGLPRRSGREAQLANLVGTNVSEGLYIVAALHEALAVPGDICEFGVAQGATSALIAGEIASLDRQFHLFDSFEGLPAPTKEDRLIHDIFGLGSMAAYKGTMASPEAEVLKKLDDLHFPRARARIHKGWVDRSVTLPDAPKSVAFAYVDFDFYEPIKVTLNYLDNVMPAGGRVVVDDYGFFSEGAQLATDEFVAASAGRWSLQKPIVMAGHFVMLSKES